MVKLKFDVVGFILRIKPIYSLNSVIKLVLRETVGLLLLDILGHEKFMKLPKGKNMKKQEAEESTVELYCSRV